MIASCPPVRLLMIVVLSLLFASVARAEHSTPNPQPAVLLRLQALAITPVTARLVTRALLRASDRRASHLILEMDTPGGLVDSTREIVQAILASEIPVVVYVYPPGARAASAGLFITLASSTAAMAPGTHIGAAHPVQLGVAPSNKPDTDGPSTMEEKTLNDARAWARSLAQLRGRNSVVAEKMVSESVTLTASEAAEQEVVDFVATDRDALLRQLGISPSSLEVLELDFGDRLLATLANPNIAFLLMILGVYGLVFEFSSPGLGLAGTLGGLCLILGAVGLALLPLNYGGLAVIGLGIALLVAEFFVTSYGLLSVGGAVCVALGGLLLVDSPAGFLRVSVQVAVPVALSAAAIALVVAFTVVRAHRAPVLTGQEALVLETPIVIEAFEPSGKAYAGRVRMHGEIWAATGGEAFEYGVPLRIVEREGLTLSVASLPPSHEGQQS